MIEFILQGKEGKQKLEVLQKINAALRPTVVRPETEPMDDQTGQLPGLPPPVNA